MKRRFLVEYTRVEKTTYQEWVETDDEKEALKQVETSPKADTVTYVQTLGYKDFNVIQEVLALSSFKEGDKIKIVDVSKIRNGKENWSNGEIVEIREIETGGEGYDRLDVWHKDKSLSEYIYPDEFEGIERV